MANNLNDEIKSWAHLIPSEALPGGIFSERIRHAAWCRKVEQRVKEREEWEKNHQEKKNQEE